MWFFYLFALVPVTIGAILLWKNKEIVWQEWIIGTIVAFIVAGIMHFIAITGMTSDEETWSGVITKVSYHPYWVERYTEHHSETVRDSKGNSHTRTWTTIEYDTHHEHWIAHRDFGTYNDTQNIEESLFNEITHKFGGKIVEDGKQSYNHFDGTKSSGDRNIYSAYNNKGYIYPVTINRSFENRIKASPTVFSFVKVPTNINVYPWPSNPDWMHSSRLLGTATVFLDTYKWDCMNSYLGPRKQVNVILVGFGNQPAEYGQWQQAKWIGGKKNDLVICFGRATRNEPAQWAYVFGWTEKELVKKNLETIFTENPINNNIIPLVVEEISKNYTIKDWSKFDYITITPPAWSYLTYFIIMIVTQGGLYWYFNSNEYSKKSSFYSRYYSNY